MNHQETFTLDQISELVNSGLIRNPANNNVASKSEKSYPSDIDNQNSGGLCMEGKVRKMFKRWVIDFRRRNLGGFVSRDVMGRMFFSKEHAEQTLNSIRAEVTNGTFKFENYKKSSIKEWQFDTRFEKYLANACSRKLKKWAPSTTVKAKQYYNKYFLPYFGTINILTLEDDHFVEFYNWLPEHLKTKTKNNIIIVLRSFMRSFKKVRERNLEFPMPEADEAEWKWIDAADQEKILAEIPAYHQPIFEFMFAHGVRPGEARALQWDCISWKEGTVTIKRTFSFYQLRDKTKGKKSRVLPIFSEFLPVLRKLPRDIKSQFVFINIRNQKGMHYGENGLTDIWNKAVKKTGMPYIRLYHATRHSFASQILDAGGDLNDIKALLGHSKIEMTERYAHRTNKRLTQAIELRKKKRLKRQGSFK